VRKGAVEEADKRHQKDLADQPAALEKDKGTSLLKQQSDFYREREALQKKVKLMEQQLQKKTAYELGHGGGEIWAQHDHGRHRDPVAVVQMQQT
jgi:hypothetical protein